jgi:hypothetical protein
MQAELSGMWVLLELFGFLLNEALALFRVLRAAQLPDRASGLRLQ